ncbi:serine hydrolase [Nocardioides hwasunensis]|uniref:Serine hydrolase n=1 Tax=Nocardioides hwasunensis TaxID=397258 RepID=A0ABR8MLJ4_9ACTN|nr:serine hydrolase [Nocardioides hwasunensis]MBD3915652.1 serine hydrolase [Nocardioides hwasunensis]
MTTTPETPETETAQAPRRLRIDDLLDLAVPSQPALSPDGRQVAYVLRTLDCDADRAVDQLWLADTSGDAPPRRLTHGPSDTAPAWSPDGATLAFLRDGRVAVVALAGGDAEAFAHLPSGASGPQWSPDGERLAFTAPVDPAGTDVPGTAPMVTRGTDYQADGVGMHGAVRHQLHVVGADGTGLRVLTDGEHGVGSPAWSPDGETIAFTRGTGDRFRVPVHVLPSGEVGARPRLVGLADGISSVVTFAADGESLLVVAHPGDPVGHQRLLRLPLAGGDAVELGADLDRNVMGGAPAYPGGTPAEHDGRVLFCLRERGCTHLWSVAADGSDARSLVDGAGRVVSGLSVAAGRAAYALATPDSYGEIAVVDLTSGAETVLTDHGAALADVVHHPREARTFTISDGIEVEAWLVHDPEQQGTRPVLLDVHGGPHNAWNGAADEIHLYHQELVERGWAVLLVNPRGSDGYGEEFFAGVRGGWGTADAKDFLEPLDQLVADGFADPHRLAVAGYSYGGFMACWLTGHDDRFAAAVAGGTVSDLVSMYGTSDDLCLSAYELGGTPWEEPEAYAAMSPLTRVADVRTPTLVLHGAEDRTCPLNQAQQWHTSLVERGVESELVVYPGASHVFLLLGLPSHRLDFNRRTLEWVTTHTTGGGRTSLDAAHWERRLHVLAERYGVPGAQLGILRMDGSAGTDDVVTATHGVLNVRTQAPVSAEALFQIGSISKVWTATVVMQLVDEGLLDLDAPVVKVLPGLELADPEITAAVTTRHLLTHTSGIDGDVFTDTGRGDDCLETYVRLLGGAGQNHPVGVTWSYCNSGYSVLGRIIEELTGLTWDQAMRERLFEPLALEHTATLAEDVLMHAAAVGHDDRDGVPTPAAAWQLPRSIGPAGLICSDAEDVLAFARLHLTGGLAADGTRVLSEESAAAMASHQADLPDTLVLGDSWGLGWIRFGWDGRRLIGHDGTTLGQNAFLRVLPDEGLAVVLLTNGGHARDLYQRLYEEVFEGVAGVTLPEPFAPPADAEVDITPYLGTYERSSVRMEVVAGDDGPVLRTTLLGPLAELEPDPTDEHELVPAAPGRFAVRPGGGETWMPVTFYELETGEPYVHFGVRATPRVSP